MSSWLTTRRAATELGISTKRLLALRSAGVFQIGKHYRVISAADAARPSYRWHVVRCGEYFDLPPEKRCR